MKRIVAIGLLFIHLGVYTEMHELMSIPLLIEHYFEHREKVPEMTFAQFLVMHYKTDVPHDATDMKLPFKDHSTVTAPTFAAPEQKVTLVVERPADVVEFSSAYFSFVPSSGLDEIFQPPKA